MSTIKDRNGVDLKKAEGIKKRWQECTEDLYKKELHDPDKHGGVITNLEPDIPECEVKHILGSLKSTARRVVRLLVSFRFPTSPA